MENIKVLIPNDMLIKKIKEIANKINKEYKGEKIKLVCILKGSIFFTCELAKYITVPVKIDFMQVSSYGNNTISSGNINIKKDLDESIENENIIIIEDIIDSGNTLKKLTEILKDRNPKSLKICTLLNKPSRRKVQINIDYNGFEIEDEFVVGFGLDYAQEYRNLPYIGIISDKKKDI